MEENLPPGFRFHPTDEELIIHYLTHKVSDSTFTSRAVSVVDFNKCEPWDLPGKASMGEKEWYFFSLRDRKYPTGLRTNRATESGYWKTTGKDKEIFCSGVLVGMKKTLVFYKGRAPRGEKSNWVMHEYRLENKHPLKTTKEEWVVCRIFQKMLAVKKPQQTISSQPSLDQESNCEINSAANEFGDLKPQNLNSVITNSSTPFNNISLSENYNVGNCNVDTSMNLNMHWPVTSDQIPTLPSLQWPPGLLSTNLSVNSLLLKALQLKSLQTREATGVHHNYAFMPSPSPLTRTSNIGNEMMSSDFNASSSKVFECMAQQQQQQQQQQEQPFNMDSINW